MPVASAIQTFLCGGSRLPFGSGTFQSRHSLRLPLSLVLTLVAMVTGTVGSPLDCRFRGMSFVCMAKSVLVSTVRKLDQRYVGGSVARGFLFLYVFRVCPTVAVMLLLFGAVCSVSLILAQFGRTHVWTKQGHIFATLLYKRRALTWFKLKPEGHKEQIGQLAEKSMTPSFVDVTLRDGFGVLQVELVTSIKFLRILKKEGLAPSIPEILYFLVKKAKSMRKHLDKYRKNRDSKFRLILVGSRIHRLARYYRCVKSLPANWKNVSATASTGTCDAPFGDRCINFFGRSKRFFV